MEAREADLAPPAGLDADSLPEGWRDQLAFRYGHAAHRVLAVAAERPELAAPIVAGQPDLLAEVVVAARLEQARSLGDVLLRRTRLALLAAPELRTPGSVAPAAAALGAELGWDRDRIARGGGGLARCPRRRGRRPGRRRNRRFHGLRRTGRPAACRYPSPPHGHPRKSATCPISTARRRARHRALPHARREELIAAITERDPDAIRARAGARRSRPRSRGAGRAPPAPAPRAQRTSRPRNATRGPAATARTSPTTRASRSAASSTSRLAVTASSGSPGSSRPRRTSTSRRRRSAAARCSAATRSPARPASRAAASAIRP